MIISNLKLKNWRNFKAVDVPLRDRMFILGPNASGKSNLLDAFRFLRDIASPRGGGLQKALASRGGIPKIRCLSARRDPEVSVEITLAEHVDGPELWRYEVAFRQDVRGYRETHVSKEVIHKNGELILNRPNAADKRDPARLTQTYLEQVNENLKFREIARFLETITYLHVVPQLLRFSDSFQGRLLESDPFGQGLLERIATAPERTQRSRLSKIEQVLKIAVPNLQQLQFERDVPTGKPHLSALYSHWRPHAGRQREDQFSDGTLRLIGLMWALLEGDSLLLLEEPELSLNSAIVSKLAPLIHRLQKQRRRQVITSTHSKDLLSDGGIDGREVILLSIAEESTVAEVAAHSKTMSTMLKAGFSVGEAVLPSTRPSQIDMFDRID